MNNNFAHSQFITLKDKFWLEKQRIAGQVVAQCLKTSKDLITNKTPNLSSKDIERECVSIIEKNKCIPTFKNYKGFSGAICVSINKQVVHGIPSNDKLKEGDVVKVDVGATYGGAIGDAAITAIYGKPKNTSYIDLLNSCRNALYKGIESIKINNRLGCIGYAIHNYVKRTNFKLINDYGGHGLDYNELHSNPFVFNKSRPDQGIRIQPGLAITIEPMLVMGISNKTYRGKNGWTVYGMGIAAQFEHSIFIGNEGVEILTLGNEDEIIF